jgi:hypothetical protein
MPQGVQGTQGSATALPTTTPQTQPTTQPNLATDSVSDIPYREWASWAHGANLYGDLSHAIHSYGRTYDIAGEMWLDTDLKILEWLKPLSAEEDEVVDWATEWQIRELPVYIQ